MIVSIIIIEGVREAQENSVIFSALTMNLGVCKLEGTWRSSRFTLSFYMEMERDQWELGVDKGLVGPKTKDRCLNFTFHCFFFQYFFLYLFPVGKSRPKPHLHPRLNFLLLLFYSWFLKVYQYITKLVEII